MSEEMTPILGSLSKFTRQLFGPSVDQIGEIVGDWARLWRVKNLLSVKEKFDRICQERGFDSEDGRRLTLAVGLPLLEKASYQDDAFLQERWAHLIASSLRAEDRAERGFSLDITYVEILNQLSQLDCEVLEYIVENGVGEQDSDSNIILKPLEPDEIQNAHPNSLAHISLEKLISLGCARSAPRIPLKTGGYRGLWEVITPTSIGINLYVSASGKTPKWLHSKNN